jgi:hypothetical protein
MQCEIFKAECVKELERIAPDWEWVGKPGRSITGKCGDLRAVIGYGEHGNPFIAEYWKVGASVKKPIRGLRTLRGVMNRIKG